MSLLPSPSSVSFSYISPQIAQGSRPPAGSWLRENGFTAVVFAAHEYQPEDRYYQGVVIVRASLDDSGAPLSSREWSDALRASAFVATLVKKDHVVYCSCWMGKNRSGLVSALAIHRLTGVSGRRAADHVRRHRPGALCNPAFSAALDALPAAQKRIAETRGRCSRLPEPSELAYVQSAYAMRGSHGH